MYKLPSALSGRPRDPSFRTAAPGPYDLSSFGSDCTPWLAAFWSTIPNLDEQSSRIRRAFRARIREMSVVCRAARACDSATAGEGSAKGYGKCLWSISYTASVVANCGDDRTTLKSAVLEK